MNTLTRLAADGTLVLIIAASAPIILWKLRRAWWVNGPVLVMAGLTSLLIGKVMSLLYQPEIARPFLQQGLEPGAAYINNPGFPSDHALLATVLVVAVYMLTRNRLLATVLLLLVVVMGVGRVAALVHTPLDVFGGVVAALFGALWYRKLTK